MYSWTILCWVSWLEIPKIWTPVDRRVRRFARFGQRNHLELPGYLTEPFVEQRPPPDMNVFTQEAVFASFLVLEILTRMHLLGCRGFWCWVCKCGDWTARRDVLMVGREPKNNMFTTGALRPVVSICCIGFLLLLCIYIQYISHSV